MNGRKKADATEQSTTLSVATERSIYTQKIKRPKKIAMHSNGQERDNMHLNPESEHNNISHYSGNNYAVSIFVAASRSNFVHFAYVLLCVPCVF